MWLQCDHLIYIEAEENSGRPEPPSALKRRWVDMADLQMRVFWLPGLRPSETLLSVGW